MSELRNPARGLVYGQLGGASRTYVTQDGIKVTDGTTTLVTVGRITAAGSDADGNPAGDFGLLIKRGILGSGTQTTIDDSGLAVTTGGVERVRVGAIGGSDYGLKVTNSGSTVIIDGSSNVFKIVATGTVSITGCAAAADTSCDVTGTTDLATGLTTVPAHVGFLEWVTGESSSLPFTFAATGASGIIGYSTDKIRLDTKVVSTNQTRVTSRYTVYGPEGVANDRTANTYTLRYHVLKEAGL